MPVPGQNPQQINQYNQQRAGHRQDLLRGTAQTNYQRELADLAFNKNVRNFNVDWGRRREQLPTNYIQRGVFNSGIYNQALQDYAQDRFRGLDDLAVQRQLGQFGNTFERRSLEDQYANQMMGSYSSQYADKAAIAADLRRML
jgi:hypothetical protein